MKVLALCDYYSPGSIGGAERVARHVYDELVRSFNCEVRVISGIPKAAPGETGVSTQDGISVDRLDGIDLSRLLGAQLLYIPGVRDEIRRQILEFSPDIIHVNGLHFHSSYIGALESKKMNIPLVATSHLGDVGALSFVSRVGASVVNHLISRKIVTEADAVIAVSSSVKDHLEHLKVETTKVRVVKNGVDHAKFYPLQRRHHDSLRVAMVGRLISNKGSLDALEAVALARRGGCNATLAILGDGPLMKKVIQRSAEPDLAGAVEVMGRVGNVEDYLREADVLMRPSLTEGLPLAIIEAMACGTPVLCTDIPGNRDLVVHGVNGLLVKVHDVEAMSRGLLRLSKERTLLESFSSTSISMASDYTWENCALGHYEVFKSLVEESV